jgi:hypothetical protein
MAASFAKLPELLRRKEGCAVADENKNDMLLKLGYFLL